MKVGIVYTSTTPELMKLVNEEIKKNIGNSCELLNYRDPSILDEIREAGYITAGAAARLVSMFMQAVSDGVDVVLNICSSVGEVADAAVNIGKFVGVPIIRIDEDMCREAVREGRRIGVLATLPSTLEPTKNTILRVAREMGKRVILVDGMIEGAFGVEQEEFKKMVSKKVGEMQDKVDVILLAQGSMGYVEELITDRYNKLVVSSPRFGAVALKQTLVEKGLI